MANTKKTTVENTEEVIMDDTPKKKEPAKKPPKKFAQDERILCRSVTGGELIYVGVKTKLYYNWMDYGD